MQQLVPLAMVDLLAQGLIAVCRVAHDDVGSRLAVQNVPALGLAQAAVFVAAGIAVVRVHLNAQVLLCVDHLDQQRETVAADISEQFLMFVPQPAQGLSLIFSCGDLAVAVGVGTGDPGFARVVAGDVKPPLRKSGTAPDRLFENRFQPNELCHGKGASLVNFVGLLAEEQDQGCGHRSADGNAEQEQRHQRIHILPEGLRGKVHFLTECRKGGARFDCGMLYYSPQIWCSDNTDARSRLVIQYGTSLFYPGCVMGAHFSTVPNHCTGHISTPEARMAAALTGTFGFELDLTKYTEEELAALRPYVAWYRKHGALLRGGELHRLVDPEPNGLGTAWMIAAKDGSEAAVFAVGDALSGAHGIASPNSRTRTLWEALV